MDRGGAELPERGQVVAGGVALVRREAVARVLVVEPGHERVPVDLGHDGGRRDRGVPPVAAD